ncbi:hypothetical protein [Gellertiella hungarica]|uniref:Flagellar protein FlgN n=1 Tax=Gellertiella hungarica TaxID=1572859 RepID=A0A7W6NK39_9HYPH|nr:hypothetical protein [Gellertiella hungarica]MBB4064149.1 hypothetical protein [Gellertiella hungarica]
MEVLSNDYRIKSVLGRLELIIDNENERIGTDPQFDLKVSNAHKSRCLYELTMLFRDTDQHEIAKGYVDQMHALRQKLATNATRVQAHLEAVRAVADILKAAMQDEDADGTYSQEQFRYGEV